MNGRERYLNIEVGGGRWSHGVDLPLVVHVVISETPLLQKAMDTQDGTHVARQVSTATRHREILCRVEAEAVDHEIPIRQVAAEKERRDNKNLVTAFMTNLLETCRPNKNGCKLA